MDMMEHRSSFSHHRPLDSGCSRSLVWWQASPEGDAEGVLYVAKTASCLAHESRTAMTTKRAQGMTIQTS